jgi:hypothetical protein
MDQIVSFSLMWGAKSPKSLGSGTLFEIVSGFSYIFGMISHLQDWKSIENGCGILKERMDSAEGYDINNFL